MRKTLGFSTFLVSFALSSFGQDDFPKDWSHTAFSENRKFRVNLTFAFEKVESGEDSDPIGVRATVSEVAIGGKRTSWSKMLDTTIFLQSPEALVSDQGLFFVLTDEFGRTKVHTPENVAEFNPEEDTSGVGVEADDPHRYLWYTGERLLEIGAVESQEVLRLWDPKHETWQAFAWTDFQPLKVDASLNKRWNEYTRKRILAKFESEEQYRIRMKIAADAPVVEKLAGTLALDQKPREVKNIERLFVASRRNPSDRVWFERMIAKRWNVQPKEAWGCGVGYQWEWGFRFYEGDHRRGQGDELLALFEGILNLNSRIDERNSRKFFLVSVHGNVRFPAPFLKDPGVARIYLIPAGEENRAWHKMEAVEKLECNLPGAHSGAPDLVDEISFSFGWVTPGKYFLKAIWDKRRPTADLQAAGPGDYESALVGPLALQPGQDLTNLVVQCDRKARGGLEYYKADALAAHQWKVTGDLSPALLPGSVREIFSRPAREWIIKTNQAVPHESARIPRIALIKNNPARAFARLNNQTPNDAGQPGLMIFWTGPDKLLVDDVRLYDEAGQLAANALIDRTGLGSSAGFYFPNFPRQAPRFRVVGFWRKHQGGAQAFDLTLTNLVQNFPEAK